MGMHHIESLMFRHQAGPVKKMERTSHPTKSLPIKRLHSFFPPFAKQRELRHSKRKPQGVDWHNLPRVVNDSANMMLKKGRVKNATAFMAIAEDLHIVATLLQFHNLVQNEGF
jgi:hypothetical protein